MTQITEYSTTYADLSGKPEPHSQTEALRIRTSHRDGAIAPTVSVVVPIFNKAEILKDMLTKLVGSLSLPFELILIDDASGDASAQIAWDFLQDADLADWTLVETPVPLYETACDNIGAALARGTYFLEVQSDIFIEDAGFDARLMRALEHGNLSSISGRACHGYGNLLPVKQHLRTCFIKGFRPQHLVADFQGRGFMGGNMFRASKPVRRKNIYWKAPTNNRGPWMVKMATFQRYGLLDSENFFLGFDDHEFNYRCGQFGMRAGYMPVNIYSREMDGSTRQKRTGKNLEIFQEMTTTKQGSQNLLNCLRNVPSSGVERVKLP